MPKAHQPRSGSMQYWPRKKAKRPYPKVHAWPESNDATLLGFAGYKAGMTHVIVPDNRKHSKAKGGEISIPVTVVECPPLKILSVLFYKFDVNKLVLKKEVAFKADKELSRRLKLPKENKASLDDIKVDEYDEIRVKVYTQPKMTGIGKKKPEIFEVCLGGSNNDQIEYIKQNIGKEIRVSDIFKPGQVLDFHAVTKGKGYQGPVKRFGVGLRSHKSEKTIRGPGSLGS